MRHYSKLSKRSRKDDKPAKFKAPDGVVTQIRLFAENHPSKYIGARKLNSLFNNNDEDSPVLVGFNKKREKENNNSIDNVDGEALSKFKIVKRKLFSDDDKDSHGIRRTVEKELKFKNKKLRYQSKYGSEVIPDFLEANNNEKVNRGQIQKTIPMPVARQS